MDEAPVRIVINDTHRVMLSCSPHARDALAVGHLLGEGWIDGPDDVFAVTLTDGPGGAYGVEVRIDADRVDAALAVRRHCTGHGCGLRHVLDCQEPVLLPAGEPTTPADLPLLFRALFAAADDASPEGGVHAAAVSNGRDLLHIAVDVARHCAVDRALGLALLNGNALDSSGIVMTSRVSGAIAQKCANAGIGWIASRSVATPLAHEIAAATGVQLHERAARRGGAA